MASAAESDRYPENYMNLLPAGTLSPEFQIGCWWHSRARIVPAMYSIYKYNESCE